MNNRVHTRNYERKSYRPSFGARAEVARPRIVEPDDFHDGWTEIRARASAGLESYEQEKIVLTSQDEQKVRRLVREYAPYIDPDLLARLQNELERALLLDETGIPGDVVTMNSRVLYEDQDSGDLAETRLVYLEPMVPGERHVSVLAPIGAALLGLSVGQTIVWPYNLRDTLRLRVAAVLYQPEAALALA
jgi:regulator of nucleoside diphosphate kinase